MTLESSLARRFNQIGVEQDDLPHQGWRRFWNDGAVLMVKYIYDANPVNTVKIVALLKEMPKV